MSDQPTLFSMTEYRKPKRRATAKTFSISEDVIKRRQVIVYLLQLILPLFVFAGVIFSPEFKSLDKIYRNQLVFATFIIIAILEIAIIAGSRIVISRLSSLRIRIAGTLKQTDGKNTQIVTLKDVARMTIYEFSEDAPHTIALRSFAGNITLWGLNDMPTARELIKAKIPDPNGRIVVKKIKHDFDQVGIIFGAIVLTTVFAFFARLYINSLSSDLGGFVVVAIGVAIFAKPFIFPKKRWSAEIDFLAGGALAISGLILLLVDMMI